MKKGVIFGLALGMFITLMAGNVLAISSDLRESYAVGETIIVKISGNVLEPIFPSQVEFLKGYAKVSFEYDIKRLGSSYYLWANSNSQEIGANYSLVIKNITTTSSTNQIERIDYVKNFTFTNISADYSITPGIVFARDDFEIKVQLNRDEEKTINVDFPERSVALKPGLNEIKFLAKDFYGAQVNIINIGDYSVPAYVIGTSTTQKTNSNISEEAEKDLIFKPNPLTIRINDLFDEDEVFAVELKNNALENISKINLNYNETLFSIDDGSGFFSGTIAGEDIEIEAGKSYYFNLTLEEIPESSISEIISAEYGNEISKLFVEIKIAGEEPEEESEEPAGEKVNYYCSELEGGIMCTANEKCSGGEEVNALDGTCCVSGKCVVEEEEGNAMLIGVIIIVVVAGILIYVWYKYKKTGSINPFKKRVEQAERNIRGMP